MEKKPKIYVFIGICLLSCVLYLATFDMSNSKTKLVTQNVKPNFVFILTDDQDSILGSFDDMKNVKQLLVNQGLTFDNSFVATPLCCPSRSSILTGQYVHNHKAINNSINGGCSSTSWQKGPEKRSFVNLLHQNGFLTFFAGKYLNQYGYEQAGGISHVPPGWDWWIGLRGNSRYYNFSLSINGTEEIHGDDPNTDYLTNIIRHRSLEFLNQLKTPLHRPFFMMLSTPACHAPFTPEPKYSQNFPNRKAPRTANFNVANDDSKHWLLRLGEQPLREELLSKIDDVYRSRLRTLLTVDDMVGDVYNTLAVKGLLDNTYIVFTSDNGYHMGQFSLPLDKREPYEFDIRVPLVIKGPNILHGSSEYPVTNIDLAPTFLDLSGITVPRSFDGTSLKPYLNDLQSNKFTEKGSHAPLHNSVMSFPLRKTFLVEHSGQGKNQNKGCESLGPNLSGCDPNYDCKCQDSKNNTYACLRHLSLVENYVYCAWDDDENFEEFYDINIDGSQLYNTIGKLPIKRHKRLRTYLNNYKKCRGLQCGKLSRFVL